jgi:putative transposase
MKNIIKLDNYYSPEDLKHAIGQFVDYYNNHRYHESLKNLTPADFYFGRADKVLSERRKIKENTLKQRRRNYIAKKLLLI